MRIIFIGPPGSGKGTYSSRIAPILGIPHISTGDIFREEVKKGTALGKDVSGYMSRGDLVPDEMTIRVLKERLSQPDAAKGFILDGYPRTVHQAEELEKLTKVDSVILLNIPEEILIEKLTARRVCSNCGAIYNIADIYRTVNGRRYHFPPMLPKKPGICDECGGRLIQRKDDTYQVIQERLEVYKKQTEPLLEFYGRRGLVDDIHVTGGLEEMVPKILEHLESLKRAPRR
jgi:adenylate kinase